MHQKREKLFGVLLAFLACHAALGGPLPQLVKNINSAVPASLNPAQFCEFGSWVFFTAETEAHGRELWRTDGTADGTAVVTDLNPGTPGSEPMDLVVSNGRLFFTANDGAHGRELWCTDGTEVGTRLVVDLQPGDGSSIPWDVSSAVRALKNGVVWFAHADSQELLLFTDSSEQGTRVLRNVSSGGGYTDGYRRVECVVAGGALYYRQYSSQGFELWRSDGTAAGTRRVRVLEPGVDFSEIKEMAALGGYVYFAFDDGSKGCELWKSNGTTAGTKLVQDALEGFDGSFPEQITVANGRVFFTALNENGTRGIWQTDGTPAGTLRVTGVPGGGAGAGPQDLAGAGGRLFFRFPTNSARAGELWMAEGNPAVASLVKVIEPGQSAVRVSDLAGGGSQLFFRVTSSEEGAELWASDGSFAGTRQARDVLPGVGSGLSAKLGVMAGRAWFAGTDDGVSASLWSSDGTEAGTQKIKSAAGDTGSDPRVFTRSGSGSYFIADDGAHGRELWFTDGSEAGTRLVKDVRAGTAGGVTEVLGTLEDGTLIFRADDGSGSALWQSDGTEAGTTLVSDPRLRPEHVQLSHLTAFDGKIFYAFNGRLWFAGEMNPAEILGTVTGVEGIIRGNGVVFFAGISSGHGKELWRSDGTLGGTYMVKDLLSGTPSSNPRHLTMFEGRCYAVISGLGGSEIWQSDGTHAGTVKMPLLNMNAIALAASADGLFVYGQEMIGGMPRSGLWVMRAGNSSFEKVRSWSAPSSVTLRLLGSRDTTLFFSVREAEGAAVLWQSQGRADNTSPVAGGSIKLTRPDAEISLLPNQLLLAQAHEVAGTEPHALALEPAWALARMNNEGEETPIGMAAEVRLWNQHPQREERLKLRLRNTGYQAISGIHTVLSEDMAGVYAVDLPQETSLAAGETLDFEVVLMAPVTGDYEARLSVNHAGAVPASLSVRLVGSIVTEGAPEFREGPGSLLLLAGQPLSLDASYLGQAPVAVSWLKNGRNYPGGLPLLISQATLADAGRYALRLRNGQGSRVSPEAMVAVVQPATPVTIFLQQETLTLACVTQAPKGVSLGYQWYRNGARLPEAGRFSGTRSARLRVTALNWDDEFSAYDCEVTLRTGDRTQKLFHGSTRLAVAELPMIDPDFEFPEVRLGESVNLTIAVLNHPERITASRLPPGVVLNTRTGQLTGKPSQVPPVAFDDQQPYWVRLTAYNKAGKSETVTLPWYVIPSILPGKYEGLITRKGTLDNGKALGSRVTLSATTRGVVTGRLFHEGKSHAFRGVLPAPSNHATLGESLALMIPRGVTRLPLTLRLSMTFGSSVDALLTDGLGNETMGGLRQTSFRGREAPRLHRGNYTVAFRAAGSPPASAPEGWGFLTLNIGSTGQTRWAGRLADGAPVTGSSQLCGPPTSDDNQAVPLYALPYKQELGSLLGWLDVGAVYDWVEEVQVQGTLNWLKNPEPGGSLARSYKDGFPEHTLTVQGGRYVPPRREEVVMWLPDEPNNARMQLSGGGLPSLVARTLTLTSVDTGAGGKRLIKMDPVWEGAPLLKWQINASTGTFSGELTFVDVNPTEPLQDVTRRCTIHGVLLPQHALAAGHFLLAQLPAAGPPATSVLDSPLISGRVEVVSTQSTASPEFAAFAEGSFQMGDTLSEGSAEELPPRTVTLNAFLIQKKEVTLEQWRAVMNWALQNGYDFDHQGSARGPNHPVGGVSWYDVVKWCNARSEMERREPCYYTGTPFVSQNVYRSGRVDVTNANFYLVGGPFYLGNGYRLPTEAEWERAARGGISGRRFPLGASITHAQASYFAAPNAPALAGIDLSESLGHHPVFGARGSPFTAPVGRFAPNPAGLYDMAGNVAEWCWDWLASYAPGSPSNPKGPNQPLDNPRRVLRGGSGQDGAMQVRSAARAGVSADSALPEVGFRVVRRN